MFSVHKEQKKMLDFLGQELQTVVSCHGGAGNDPRSFEDQQVHLMLSHLSNPIYYRSQSYTDRCLLFPIGFSFLLLSFLCIIYLLKIFIIQYQIHFHLEAVSLISCIIYLTKLYQVLFSV